MFFDVILYDVLAPLHHPKLDALQPTDTDETFPVMEPL